jgi:hypothetical protein
MVDAVSTRIWQRYGVKVAEDDGVSRGFVGQDLPEGYAEADLSDNIDRAFDAAERYWSDSSNMTQPGVLHGTINRWNRKGVATPETVAPPLFTSPTAR